MRTVQQGSEKSQSRARQCVEVKAQAASVPHSAHMDSSTVECVGKSLATSLEGQMVYKITTGTVGPLTLPLLMA